MILTELSPKINRMLEVIVADARLAQLMKRFGFREFGGGAPRAASILPAAVALDPGCQIVGTIA